MVDVGDVLRFLRRRGEADLRGVAEVFEGLAPRRVFGGDAAVTLVEDNEVEDVWRALAEELLPFRGSGDGLVEALSRLIALPEIVGPRHLAEHERLLDRRALTHTVVDQPQLSTMLSSQCITLS